MSIVAACCSTSAIGMSDNRASCLRSNRSSLSSRCNAALANKASLTTKLFRLLMQAMMRRSCESSLDCSRAQLIDDLTIIMTKPLRESILQSSHLTKNLVNSFWDSSMYTIEYNKSFVFDHSPWPYCNHPVQLPWPYRSNFFYRPPTVRLSSTYRPSIRFLYFTIEHNYVNKLRFRFKGQNF